MSLEDRRLARYEDERRRQRAAPEVPDDERWNHQIHYQPVLLDAIPGGARLGLDIGCGEGLLTRRLAQRVDHAIGLDRDVVPGAEYRRRVLFRYTLVWHKP